MLAERLEFTHVDSGSFYRIVTFEAMSRNVQLTSETAVCEMMDKLHIDFVKKGVSVVMIVDGKDNSQEIRSIAVSEKVSIVAAMPEVRKRIVNLLRQMTKFGSLVMEGRDIGTVVFPDTPLKYYLDASPEERAKRRAYELQKVNTSEQNAIRNNIEARDRLDSSRKVAPLKIAPDAVIVDTTNMKLEEVVEYIFLDYKKKLYL